MSMMPLLLRMVCLVAAGVAPAAIRGADIRVGIDTSTIAEAIGRAEPGDTIHLEPKVYRECAEFAGIQGSPGKPITLDGHGATLDGSDPLDPADWQEVSPGLFANDSLLPKLNTAIIDRWFFLWDGRANHMGRTAKGKKAPLVRPEELKAGEWTFARDSSREQPSSREIFGTFFLKLAAGQTLDAACIAAPVRSAGVLMRGDNKHLVIRNLTATHAYNDGFNIHGDCRDVVFENIAAIECGDDGISGHETAEYRVDGLVSIGNSTGITDIGEARTRYNRVLIADCLAYDLYFWERGRYQLSNAIIVSSAERPFVVEGRDGHGCTVELDNVLFRRVGPPAPARFMRPVIVKAKRLTMEGIGIEGDADVTLDDSVIDGRPTRPGVRGAEQEELLRIVPRPPASDIPSRRPPRQ
jgi:hypothetical protein